MGFAHEYKGCQLIQLAENQAIGRERALDQPEIMRLRCNHTQFTFSTGHIRNDGAGGALPHGCIVAIPVDIIQQTVEGTGGERQPLAETENRIPISCRCI